MRSRTAPALETVGAALVDARTALAECEAAGATVVTAQAAKVHDALVALALASYDALAHWEAEIGEPGQGPGSPLAERVTRWRGQLDDLRVQVALAEMELRESSQDLLAAAERSVNVVETRLATAGKEIGSAVTDLRKELQRT